MPRVHPEQINKYILFNIYAFNIANIYNIVIEYLKYTTYTIKHTIF